MDFFPMIELDSFNSLTKKSLIQAVQKRLDASPRNP
jgi:hypothetical protein